MAEPTPKSDVINNLISGLAGQDRVSTIKADICMLCGNKATKFKDELSLREYAISGMCQTCQDKSFGPDEPDPDESTPWRS